MTSYLIGFISKTLDAVRSGFSSFMPPQAHDKATIPSVGCQGMGRGAIVGSRPLQAIERPLERGQVTNRDRCPAGERGTSRNFPSRKRDETRSRANREGTKKDTGRGRTLNPISIRWGEPKKTRTDTVPQSYLFRAEREFPRESVLNTERWREVLRRWN